MAGIDAKASQAAEKNMVKFLETWAPLRKYREPVSDNLGNRARPALHMACPTCGSSQTFNVQIDPRSEYHYFYESVESPFDAELWRYLCMGCRRFGRTFFLEYMKDERGGYIRKLGQKPEWEAEVPSQLKDSLGPHAAMFQRGKDCEGTGYGIGAYAYYRRIVEDTIGGLLERVPALLSDIERPQFLAALELVRKTTVTQEKIELVKNLLPARLRPDGVNPLEVLHSELSTGLHGKSDEDCLDDAEAVRSSLTYLTVELSRAENARKEFTDGMRKFLEKRQGK